MFTLLTDAAKAALAATRLGAAKLQFVRFEVGTQAAAYPDLRTEEITYGQMEELSAAAAILAGWTPHHVGQAASMAWLPSGFDRATLRCYVPPATDYFHFNGVIVWARVGTAAPFPFSFSYYNVTNPKFDIEITAGGTRYYWLMNLHVDVIEEKFDVANLPVDRTDFDMRPTLFDLDFAFKEQPDQVIVNRHFNVPRPHPVLVVNSQEQWQGTLMFSAEFAAPNMSKLRPMTAIAHYRIVDYEVYPTFYAVMDEDGNPQLDFAGNEMQEPATRLGYHFLIDRDGQYIITDDTGLPIVVNAFEAAVRPYLATTKGYPMRDTNGELMFASTPTP